MHSKFVKYLYIILNLVIKLQVIKLLLKKPSSPHLFINNNVFSLIDFWTVVIHIIENHIDIPNMIQNHINQLAGQLSNSEYCKKGADLLLDPATWLISSCALPVIENIYCYMFNSELDTTIWPDSDLDPTIWPDSDLDWVMTSDSDVDWVMRPNPWNDPLIDFEGPYTLIINGQTYPNPGESGNIPISVQSIVDQMLSQGFFLRNNPEVLESVQNSIQNRDYRTAIGTMITQDDPIDNLTGGFQFYTLIAFHSIAGVTMLLSNFIQHHIPDDVIFRGFNDLSHIVEVSSNSAFDNNSSYNVELLNSMLERMYSYIRVQAVNILDILNIFLAYNRTDPLSTINATRTDNLQLLRRMRILLIYIFTFSHWATSDHISIYDHDTYIWLEEIIRSLSL